MESAEVELESEGDSRNRSFLHFAFACEEFGAFRGGGFIRWNLWLGRLSEDSLFESGFLCELTLDGGLGMLGVFLIDELDVLGSHQSKYYNCR